MSSRFKNHLDLDQMPVIQKQNLCDILDQNDSWKELGVLMQFELLDPDIVRLISKEQQWGGSPSNALITRWSSRYAHNVTELFKLLSLMQHFQAMTRIKDLVDEKYHVWLPAPLTEQNDWGDLQALNLPEFSMKTFEKATDGWTKNVIGRGGFGIVYKINWISTDVAIKKIEYLERRSKSLKVHFGHIFNELRSLYNCRHDNVISVYGYAIKDSTIVIVYELMLGGNLKERLQSICPGHGPLTWTQRWHFVKGSAKGLQFMHQYNTKPLIHGDIKPENIFISVDGVAKIGDFGLSRVGHLHDECQQLSKVFGSEPYLPYEFIRQRLFSTKVDVFSFGVVLFELATGYSAHDKNRADPFLYDHMKKVNEEQIKSVIDPSTSNDEACLNMCNLMVFWGKRCTDEDQNKRPEMKEVFKALEKFVP